MGVGVQKTSTFSLVSDGSTVPLFFSTKHGGGSVVLNPFMLGETRCIKHYIVVEFIFEVLVIVGTSSFCFKTSLIT